MLEAQRRGLTAHPMGGFSREQAREAFSIPDEYSIVHVMAVGWPGEIGKLSPRDRERNHPMPRKAVEDLLL